MVWFCFKWIYFKSKLSSDWIAWLGFIIILYSTNFFSSPNAMDQYQWTSLKLGASLSGLILTRTRNCQNQNGTLGLFPLWPRFQIELIQYFISLSSVPTLSWSRDRWWMGAHVKAHSHIDYSYRPTGIVLGSMRKVENPKETHKGKTCISTHLMYVTWAQGQTGHPGAMR